MSVITHPRLECLPCEDLSIRLASVRDAGKGLNIHSAKCYVQITSPSCVTFDQRAQIAGDGARWNTFIENFFGDIASSMKGPSKTPLILSIAVIIKSKEGAFYYIDQDDHLILIPCGKEVGICDEIAQRFGRQCGNTLDEKKEFIVY